MKETKDLLCNSLLMGCATLKGLLVRLITPTSCCLQHLIVILSQEVVLCIPFLVGFRYSWLRNWIGCAVDSLASAHLLLV